MGELHAGRSLSDIDVGAIKTLWWRGGLPPSFLAASDDERRYDDIYKHLRNSNEPMKFAIKKILLFLALLAVLPLIAVTWLTIKLIGGDTAKKIFIYCGEILSICPTAAWPSSSPTWWGMDCPPRF